MGRPAGGLFFEREALGVIRQTIAFTLYNLGNELSLAYNGPHVKTSNEDLMVNIRS